MAENTRPVAPLTTADGAPLCVELTARVSTTVPGRLKVALIAPIGSGIGVRRPDDGKIQAVKADGPADGLLVCPEFRLEMS